MYLIIGYIIVLVSSIGTYAIHGDVRLLWVPTEYAAIVGLTIGGFVAGNNINIIKHTLKAIGPALKPSKYNKAFYIETLALIFEILSKAKKEGLMAIEADVEEPEKSALFKKYPTVTEDHHIIDFITDYLRMMIGGNLNPNEIENLMDVELEGLMHEEMEPAHVMAKTGDATPAFGIVVAVMGVVNVMSSVGQPPAVLGKMIGGALVGTFLGILVSYGFIAPIASLLEQKAKSTEPIFKCIKMTLLASMSGYAPAVAVEFGRKAISLHDRPSFKELEADLKARKGK